MKLFITGASGFVGATTLGVALEAGHEVAAPVQPGSSAHRLAPFEGRYRRFSLDLRDAAAAAAAIAEFRPDAVLHLAWWGVANSARFERRQVADNVETACVLTEAAAASGARAFIGVGSQGEYGAGSTMREDALPRPTSLYGAAKVAALYLTRQLAEQSGLRHAWLRLFSVYGPGDNDCWLIPILITEMLAGRRPRTTLGTQEWDWLHVDDVARAILSVAATATAEGVFNLGSGRAVPVRSVTERIRDLAAPGMELVFGEIPFRPDQVMHMQANISRLTSATGWTPRIPIEEGLAATVAWYRARAPGGSG
jgi:nucleoside-diphosphate-sugar epimerase